jgi:hypothetical protein
MKTKTSPRFWAALALFSLIGQIAWVVENMYFNVFIYKMFHASAGDISMMVGASAVTATLTTVLMGALSDRIDLLMDEKRHVAIETALQGLCEKGLLSVEMAGFAKDEPVYRLSRTAIERLDDGLLLDTVWFADRTDPKKTRELLFALRRDGVCAVIPNAKGVALRNFDQIPWEELI